ncbi:MAG: PIN domain-containing protein [Solirubrobacterales bacterium]
MVDAGILFAAADAREADHNAARKVLTEWPGELVVSAFTAAEADYLILSRLGLEAEIPFIEDLASTYTVDTPDRDGFQRAANLCRQYADLKIGLADASMIVLSERWSTRSVASLDRRHFRAVRPLDGGAFELHPDHR